MLSINYKYNLNNDFSDIFRNNVNLRAVYNGFSANIIFDEKRTYRNQYEIELAKFLLKLLF